MRRTHSEPKPGVRVLVEFVAEGQWAVVRLNVLPPFKTTLKVLAKEQDAEEYARAVLAAPVDEGDGE